MEKVLLRVSIKVSGDKHSAISSDSRGLSEFFESIEGIRDEMNLSNIQLGSEFETSIGKVRIIDINTCFELRYSIEHDLPFFDVKYIVEKIS